MGDLTRHDPRNTGIMHGARDTLRFPLFTLVEAARAAAAANDTFADGSDETTAVGLGPALARRRPARFTCDDDPHEPPPRSTLLPSPPVASEALPRTRTPLPDLTFGDAPEPTDAWRPSELAPDESTERLLRLSLTELVNHYARLARARERAR